MTTATEGIPQEHHIPFPPLRTRSVQPSTALFIPEIMFEIGTYLQKQELWSSSLVCLAWHKVFSPFLNWTVLDHCQEFLKGTLHILCPENRVEWHCRKSYVYLDAILERIDLPDAAFGFHCARNVHLSNRHFKYVGPCSDSTTKERWNPRLDRLYIMIVEKSTLLEKLELRPRHPTDDHCYTWTTPLQIESGIDLSKDGTFDSAGSANHGNNGPLVPDVPSMVLYESFPPRWPHLVKVELLECRMDHSFLPVLLNNAPALADLCLYEVIVRQANVVGCPVIQDSVDNNVKIMSPLTQRRGVSWEASVIQKLIISGTVGLKWSDVFVFASQLPRLLEFSFKPAGEWTEKKLPPTAGFSRLEKLYLHNFPGNIAAFVVQSVPSNIFDLRLFKTQLDRSLVQSLALTHTHHLQYVYISECSQVESDHVLHFILCTLQGLRSFKVFKPPMICDPRVLQQTPWVCRNLRQLHVVPKCNSSSEYPPLEAQQAFMTQVGSLTRLAELHLACYTIDGVANGYIPEISWRLFTNLKDLRSVDLGFSPDAQLNTGDAETMIQCWPNLQKLHSINPERQTTFMTSMKEHGPNIQVKKSSRF